MKLRRIFSKAVITPVLWVLFALFSLFAISAPVSAVPTPDDSAYTITQESGNLDNLLADVVLADVDTVDGSTSDADSTTSTEEGMSCFDQIGPIGWLVCPTTGVLTKAIDGIYGFIEQFLVVEPLSTDHNSPIYIVWEYARNITNIIFIIFILIIVYSQITGLGISNYGIKKTLPRLVIAAILVNLSFIICALAVDVSNILGANLKSFFAGVEEMAVASGAINPEAQVSWAELFAAVSGGGAILGISVIAGLAFAGGPVALLLTLLPFVLAGLASVVVGLATVSLRQAVVSILIMISPLAFVAYLLPNTEPLFKKWSKLLQQMLIFYPLFSLLFGASHLAGWVLISSAKSVFGILLGMAVQIFPLFFGISLLKMSNSMLGKISGALSGLSKRATGGLNRALENPRNLARAKYTAEATQRGFNPLRGGSWRAAFTQLSAENKAKTEKYQRTQNAMIAERINARTRGERIVGYRNDGTPIYSAAPVRSNSMMRAEAQAREAELRLNADTIKTDRALSQLGTYMEKTGMQDDYLKELTKRQAENYLNLRTQQTAKKLDDRADNRFYFQQVKNAVKLGSTSDRYKQLIDAGAGADFYSENSKTKNDAIASVVADSYDAFESERKITTQKYVTYFGKQVTEDVIAQYKSMLNDKNIDGIVAAQEVLAQRGDYDTIGSELSTFMDEGNVKLGEDLANTLALNILKMKDADPTLGRLGKFINMETWQYTSGNRKTQEVTMKQFFTGKVDGEPDYKGTKINVISGLQGTSFKNMDRTAIGNLIELSQKYLSPEEIVELDKAIMPQLVSAMPTFDSGSEQIVNAVGYLTGMNQLPDGSWSSAKRLDPTKHDPRKDVPLETFVKRTDSYLKALTPNDLVYLKSDTFNGAMALFEEYYGGDEAKAVEHFRTLFGDSEKGNNNINKLRAGDQSALAPMKDAVRKALGL